MSKTYAALTAPGEEMVALTPGAAAFAGGVCKGLWIGVTGTINITTKGGTALDGIIAPVGLFPIRCTHLRAGGTATDVLAIY